MKKIYLASTSPQRKMLLKQLLGSNFEIVNSDFEEDNMQKISPEELVKVHSLGKARAAVENLNSGVVIGSDCILYFNGKVLGKPHTLENAKKILKEISGQMIEAYSGVALVEMESGKESVDYDVARLKIKELSLEEIEIYVNLVKPVCNAGAINIYSVGSVFVEKIEGDYYSIVGLPLFKLNQMFENLDISIYDYMRLER